MQALNKKHTRITVCPVEVVAKTCLNTDETLTLSYLWRNERVRRGLILDRAHRPPTYLLSNPNHEIR
jgi:hypothetical protein